MPLDEETLKAIKDAVQDTVKSSFTEYSEVQNRNFQKSQDNLKKEFTNLFETKLNERFETITPSLSFIEDVRKEYEEEVKNGNNNPTDNEDEKPGRKSKGKKEALEDTSALEQKLRADFEAKLAEDRKRVTELEAQLKQDQERAREEQEKARVTTLRNQALNTIRELNIVSPGKEQRLFTLLEQDGRLVKTDDGFKIASKDKFNDDIQLNITEALPDLIKSSYDEYSIPRGGTGTGAINSTRNNQQNLQDFSGLTAQQIYDQKNALGADLIKTLEQTYSV